MTRWDDTKKYLIFYARDDSIIPRRDIRNQLKDAVEAGDKLQERNKNINDKWEKTLINWTIDVQKLDAIQKALDNPDYAFLGLEYTQARIRDIIETTVKSDSKRMEGQ